jgi:hypothetical protein
MPPAHKAVPALLAALPALIAFAAQAEGLDLISKIHDIEAGLLSDLPANRADVSESEFCQVIIGDPRTLAGSRVMQLQWKVTDEPESGDLTFVSFVGKVEPGNSGSCRLSEGNIGIFCGDSLQELIYAGKEARQGIGSIQVLEGERLRIWDGDYLSTPLADLQIVDGNLVILGNVADRDTFCGGAASAPNIFCLPVHFAPRLLLAEGWQPAQSGDAASATYIMKMMRVLPELQECSGTGFDFCAWEYTKGTGQVLCVVTAGEANDGSSPAVTGFQVACAGQAAE